MRPCCLLAVVAFLLSVSTLSGRDAREQARIDFILRQVETSTGIRFIRNGTEHDGAAAASHLRAKLSAAGMRVTTAEDFIKYCASESSLTHQQYKVKLADGTILAAATYFQAELSKFDRTSR